MLPKKQYFTSAPVDEVSLFRKADEIIAASDEPLIPYESLLEKNNRDGIDIATAVLYRSLLRNASRQEFKTKIDLLPVEPPATRKNVKILLVPGMFYKEYPDVGSGGDLIIDIAKKFDYNVEQVQTASLGSPTDNKAKVIENILLNSNVDNLWVISVSRGGAEVRLALQDIGIANMPSNFGGWINISGVVNGTPLADSKFTNTTQQYLHTAFCKAVGMSTSLAKDSRTNSDLWAQPIALPAHSELIHVLGFPLLSHVEGSVAKRFKKLVQFGPNDGIIPLYDTLTLSGNVYPIWGADHLLRVPQYSELIYKLMTYINNKSN